MAEKKPPEEKVEDAPEEEKPAWEGSLSDHKTPPAPDGHDFYKNLLDA